MEVTSHLLQITQSSPNEMEERIYNRLKSEFDTIKKEFKPKEPTIYLTRSEVRDLLQVNLSTVHNLTKRGKLKAYGLGGRVYYKRDEVEAAIKPLNF